MLACALLPSQHPFNGNESFTDAHGWHSGHNRTKTDWGVVWERVQQQLLTHAKQRGQQVTFKVEYDRWAHLEQLKFTLQEPKTKKKVSRLTQVNRTMQCWVSPGCFPGEVSLVFPVCRSSTPNCQQLV